MNQVCRFHHLQNLPLVTTTLSKLKSVSETKKKFEHGQSSNYQDKYNANLLDKLAKIPTMGVQLTSHTVDTRPSGLGSPSSYLQPTSKCGSCSCWVVVSFEVIQSDFIVVRMYTNRISISIPQTTKLVPGTIPTWHSTHLTSGPLLANTYNRTLLKLSYDGHPLIHYKSFGRYWVQSHPRQCLYAFRVRRWNPFQSFGVPVPKTKLVMAWIMGM